LVPDHPTPGRTSKGRATLDEFGREIHDLIQAVADGART
jgi:hypothetical protein